MHARARSRGARAVGAVGAAAASGLALLAGGLLPAPALAGAETWSGPTKATLAQGGPEALRLLGAPGGGGFMVPVWPEELEPGQPGWPRALARAMGIDRTQEDLSWVDPGWRPRLKGYLAEGSPAKAAVLLEDLLLAQGNNLRLHMLSGWLYETLGRSDLARDRYRAAQELAMNTEDVDRVRCALLRMSLRFGHGGALREKIEVLERIARVARDQGAAGAGVRLAAALGWRALLAMAAGQPGRAQELFAAALAEEPGNLALRVNRVLAEAALPMQVARPARLSQGAAAVAAVRGTGYPAEVTAALEDLQARMDLLRLRALRDAGQPDAALAEAEMGWKQDPTEPRRAQFLGETYARAQAWDQAAQAYAAVRTHHPLAVLRERAAADEAAARAREDELRAHQVPPDEVAMQEASMLLDRPQYREAARILRRARRRVAAARPREALLLLREGARDWPEVVQFPLERGRLLASLGRHAEAQVALQAALEVDPDRSETHAFLAQVMLARGDAGPGAPEALRHADRAKQLAAEAPALHARGWALSALGNPRQGAEELRAALELDPENPEIHYRLGLALLALDLEASALEHFRKVEALAPGHPRGGFMEGVALARLGRREEALARLSQVAQSGPRELQRVARETLARLTGQLRERTPSDRPDLSVPAPGLPPPGNSLPRTTSILAAQRGPAFEAYQAAAERVAGGSLDEAKAALRELLEKHPAYAEPAVALAVLSLLDSELDGARRAADAVLDLRPDDPRGLVAHATLSLLAGDGAGLARAVSGWGRSPARLPDDAFLARVEGRWDRVLDVDPYRAEAHWHRGMLRLFRGELTGAASDLEAAGRDPRALRGRALLALLRFAREKDGKFLKQAGDILGEVGPRGAYQALEQVRREVLRGDEVEAAPVVFERTWDRATATAYVQASPQVKSLVLGLPVDGMDITHSGLLGDSWGRIDGSLRRKGSTGAAPERVPAEGAGVLDIPVLLGAKAPEPSFPPPGIRARTPYDLPGEAVFDEGLFDEGGELEGPGAGEGPGPESTPPEIPLEPGTAAPGDDLEDLDLDLEDLAGNPLRAEAAPARGSEARAPTPAAAAAVPAPPPRLASVRPPGGEAMLEAALGPLLQGRPDLAATRLEALVARFPDWEGARRDLSMLSLDLDRHEVAARVGREAAARFGPDPFYARLEGLLAEAAGDLVETARWQRAAASGRPREGGGAYPAVARRAWQQMLDRGAGEASAAYRLARLAFYEFRDQEARDQLRAAGDMEEAVALARHLDAAPGGG